MTSIGEEAFSYCDGLQSLIVDKGNQKYDSRNDCNAIIETQSNILIAGCKNTTIPNSVTSIESWAFDRCKILTSITIPNSVTSIGWVAFASCSGLTSLTIGNSVTSIGWGAFAGCPNITSVTNLSTTPQKIDEFTFSTYGTLHVLPGCKAKYEAVDFWKNFTIIEDATTGINVVKDSSTISADKIFSISGQRLDKPQADVSGRC